MGGAGVSGACVSLCFIITSGRGFGSALILFGRFSARLPFPGMVHPLTMACHALAMGLAVDDVLAACLAHDMVEGLRDMGKQYGFTQADVNRRSPETLKNKDFRSKMRPFPFGDVNGTRPFLFPATLRYGSNAGATEKRPHWCAQTFCLCLPMAMSPLRSDPRGACLAVGCFSGMSKTGCAPVVPAPRRNVPNGARHGETSPMVRGSSVRRIYGMALTSAKIRFNRIIAEDGVKCKPLIFLRISAFF